MSLFQKSVLSKYLKGIDEDALATQWQVFKQHFHNPTIQQNIRQSKEEQYQEGFLDDLFVKVLGYTKNPEPNFNLTTELPKEYLKITASMILYYKILLLQLFRLNLIAKSRLHKLASCFISLLATFNNI